MGKVIKVDFQRDRRKDYENYLQFELNLRRYHQKQQFKTALLLSGFSAIIILSMLIPFVIFNITH